MHIIVVKDRSSYHGAPLLALCEVVRKTEKRFYVRLIKGDKWALDGNYRADPYVPAESVLSFDAAQYDAMVAAVAAYEARKAELDAMEAEAWNVMAAVLRSEKQEEPRVSSNGFGSNTGGRVGWHENNG